MEVSPDQQFNKDLQNYLAKMSDSRYSKSGFVRQILASPSSQYWKILEQLLEHSKKKNQSDYKDIVSQIEFNYRNVKSFTMLLYLYQLQKQDRLTYIKPYWSLLYREICEQSGDIVVFSTWVSANPKSPIVQDTLWLVVKTYPSFIKKIYSDINQMELNAIIEWVTYLQTPDPDRYNAICEIVKVVKQGQLKIKQDYVKKEHIILKKLLQIVGESQKPTGNTFLFIYPFCLKEADINYFVHLQCDFLVKLKEDCLINFFSAITKSAMSRQIIYLIQKISQLLKVEDQFFKLRILYQKFILPVIVRRAKSCHRVEIEVFQLSSFFILGFLQHCNIGKEGISCILKNIEKVREQQVRLRWIQICMIIANRYPNYQKQIQQVLTGKFKIKIETAPEYYAKKYNLSSGQVVWQVTFRSSRKHKQYPKVASKMQGLQNYNNQCYIISTVQALHHTSLMKNILQPHRINNNLLYELRVLFRQLSGEAKKKIVKVTYLKANGPEQFRDSKTQQDSYEYIMALFELIQKQLKRNRLDKLLEQFNKIFEVSIVDRLVCKNCQNVSESLVKSYMHTISNTEVLQESTEQKLPEFKCEKCNGVECISIFHTIKPTSQILIVHINRFSHEGGKTKKQLSTQMIPRNFLHYELVGMVCHYGKNVQNGHYLYYGKLSAKRWAQFNDQYVWEFDLEKENEEFERQMKAQMTPYILFYKKIQK